MIFKISLNKRRKAHINVGQARRQKRKLEGGEQTKDQECVEKRTYVPIIDSNGMRTNEKH